MNIQTVISRPVLHCISLVLLSFTLSSCAYLFSDNHPSSHAKHAQPHYTVEAYVAHVALAKLALEKTPPDTNEAAPHLAFIHTHTVRKQKKTVIQPVILLEYTVTGKQEVQHIIAPFSILPETEKFPVLLDIMTALNSTSYTLHDIRPLMITVAPTKPISFTSSDSTETKAILDNQLQHWMQKPLSISPSEEVRIQLRLIQFFIDNHQRDAAYLCIENAKHTLATAAETDSIQPETAKNLSEKLEVLEGQLHKALPFTMSF